MRARIGDSYMSGQLFHSHTAVALSVACAPALPRAAQAQSSTHEQPLEQRVSQLEQQLHELQQMAQAQAAQPATHATSQPVAAATVTPATPPVFTSAQDVSVALHGFVSATAFECALPLLTCKRHAGWTPWIEQRSRPPVRGIAANHGRSRRRLSLAVATPLVACRHTAPQLAGSMSAS